MPNRGVKGDSVSADLTEVATSHSSSQQRACIHEGPSSSSTWVVVVGLAVVVVGAYAGSREVVQDVRANCSHRGAMQLLIAAGNTGMSGTPKRPPA